MPRFEIIKQEKENNQGLIRRFTRRLKESGILLSAKKTRFRQRPKNATAEKVSTLRRIQKKAEYEKAQKLGR